MGNWEDSWKNLHMKSGFSSAVLGEHRRYTKILHRRGDELYLFSREPEGEADVYRELPKWVDERLAATKSQLEAPEGLLALFKCRSKL
jgi:hypothetical protein